MKKFERDLVFEACQSNEVLSEDIQNRIRNLLSLLQREVESLNLEISALRSTGETPLEELLADCARKTTEMKVLRGAISPLKMIPREILCEFFDYANDSKSLLTIPRRQSRAFPWPLVQVCSHWRDIMFGMSGVWENIKIRDDIHDPEIPAVISIFQVILARSAAQISLIVPRNDRLFNELVIPSLTRLKGLETIVDRDTFRTLLELPRGSVDSLASIDLHFVSGNLLHIETNPFQTSPNLRNVTLTNGPGISWPRGIWLLPWALLTDIAIPTSAIPIPTLHTILGQCVCLCNAILVIGDDALPDSLGKEVVVPTLESLSLHQYGRSPNWEAFLRPLILPSFQSIVVNDAQTWSQTAFTSLVIRSACPLKSILLVYYRDTTYDLYPLLTHAPLLRKLIIPWFLIPASIFQAIRRREILPALIHLSCAVDPPGLSAALDLLESSVSGQPGSGASITQIQAGSFYCSDEGWFDDILERYYSLEPKFRGNGMDITISS